MPVVLEGRRSRTVGASLALAQARNAAEVFCSKFGGSKILTTFLGFWAVLSQLLKMTGAEQCTNQTINGACCQVPNTTCMIVVIKGLSAPVLIPGESIEDHDPNKFSITANQNMSSCITNRFGENALTTSPAYGFIAQNGSSAKTSEMRTTVPGFRVVGLKYTPTCEGQTT